MHWRAIGKILISVAATAMLAAFAMPFAIYGTLGLRAAFTEHLSLRSEAAMVYWVLLFVAAVFALLLVLTWFLLLRAPRLKAAQKRQ